MEALKLNESKAGYLTESYKDIKTSDLIKTFESNGFEISHYGKSSLIKPTLYITPEMTQEEVIQANDKFNKRITRYNERQGRQKHFIRLSTPSLRSIDNRNMFYLRITNSYDGTSSLKIDLDILRLVCLNGLIAPRSMFSERVMHKGNNVIGNVIEACNRVIENKQGLENQIISMENTILNYDDKLTLGQKLLDLRFNSGKVKIEDNLHILIPKRFEEKQIGNTLWQQFNTIQEFCIRGTFLVDANGKSFKSREVKSTVSVDNFNDNAWKTALDLVK